MITLFLVMERPNVGPQVSLFRETLSALLTYEDLTEEEGNAFIPFHG